jgi:hypothetical protein
MSAWRIPIYCYVSPAQNNKIADWYAGLSIQGKADADEFLKNMRRTGDWKMPHYRPKLRGIRGVKDKETKGLGELRWTSEKVEQRLVGFFRDSVWYALVGCTHKNQVYNPHNALANAVTRKAQIEAGQVRTVEYDL